MPKYFPLRRLLDRSGFSIENVKLRLLDVHAHEAPEFLQGHTLTHVPKACLNHSRWNGFFLRLLFRGTPIFHPLDAPLPRPLPRGPRFGAGCSFPLSLLLPFPLPFGPSLLFPLDLLFSFVFPFPLPFEGFRFDFPLLLPLLFRGIVPPAGMNRFLEHNET